MFQTSAYTFTQDVVFKVGEDLKKQQMAWTLRGAHLLLQTRTKVLNHELDEVFRGWYPQFRAEAA